MKHALAQFLRILLQKLEEGSDERDVVSQVKDRFDVPTPMTTKRNQWRAGRDSGRFPVLPYRDNKRGRP